MRSIETGYYAGLNKKKKMKTKKLHYVYMVD